MKQAPIWNRHTKTRSYNCVIGRHECLLFAMSASLCVEACMHVLRCKCVCCMRVLCLR